MSVLKKPHQAIPNRNDGACRDPIQEPICHRVSGENQSASQGENLQQSRLFLNISLL